MRKHHQGCDIKQQAFRIGSQSLFIPLHFSDLEPPIMRFNPQELNRTRQQNIAELSHQLRYANSAEERHRIKTEIDFWRRVSL